MKTFFLACFFVLSACLFSQIPAGYYSDTSTLSGFALKSVLHEIINDHTQRSYSNLWTDFQTTDVKPNGEVWDIYSDIPGGTPPYSYTFVTDQCGTYGAEGDCYNREHSFPKSWFANAYPMYTDLFHMYPTDGYVNGMRSNYPYGEVVNPSKTSLNGSKVGPNVSGGYTGTVFEPLDEYKGDLARTYFYMATRYEDVISGWESNNSRGNDVLDGTSDMVFEDWFFNLIFNWHTNDAVSQKEIDRNNAIYSIQGNRNPFIDHPEWVTKIWVDSSFSDTTNTDTILVDQEYFLASPSDKPIWMVREHIENNLKHRYYTFSGDSVYNAKTYVKLIASGDTSFSQSEHIALLRAEGERIYCILFGSMAEFIAYDFSMNVGNVFVGVNDGAIQLQHIDSMLIDDSYFTRFEFSDNVQWFERILDQRGPVHPYLAAISGNYNEHASNSCDSMNYWSKLVCYTENDEPIYVAQGCNCDLSITNQITTREALPLSIFPNPSKNREIKLLFQEPNITVSIYNQQGRLIIKKNSVQSGDNISLKNHNPGIYIILGRGINGTIYTSKLILTD
jgi:endonuclease I